MAVTLQTFVQDFARAFAAVDLRRPVWEAARVVPTSLVLALTQKMLR